VTELRIPIIDGHNDALLRVQMDGISFLERNEAAGLDLPLAEQGGMAAAFFAVYIPPAGMRLPSSGIEVARLALATFSGHADDPPPPDLHYSRAQALRMMASLFRMERESGGRFTVVRTADELEQVIAARAAGEGAPTAAILHFEGAEAIDLELNGLEVFYHAGLRSLGIVHSRNNAFGHGVPYGFPRSPDTGAGLTEFGRELVRACNRLGIMIDLSHLNMRGFWDVAELTDAPLVATHSCVHAICPATRNLTDDQLRAIGQSNGMVGLNFHVSFLRPDGEIDVDTPLSVLVRHIDHIVELAGIDCVGLGSDYDYIAAPREITTVADLPNLITALQEAGYRGEDLEKLLNRNWLRVLRATWAA
jgi:membrane dipeptidase